MPLPETTKRGLLIRLSQFTLHITWVNERAVRKYDQMALLKEPKR